MKSVKTLIFSSMITVLGVTNPAAAGFGSFISDLKEAGSNLASVKSGNDDDTKQPLEKTAVLSGRHVELHDYEGALTDDDKTCTHLIEPFETSQNIEKLLEKSTQGGFKALLDGNDILSNAKAEAKRLNWLPLSIEVEYGDKIHNEEMKTKQNFLARPGKGLVKRDYKKADAALQKILTAINEEHPYEFKLFLLDDRSINAQAGPGGYIYLNTGALNSDALELTLGHEIAHVLKRHQTREMQARLIDSVESFRDLKKLVKNDAQNSDKLLTMLASVTGAVHYSQQQELQADACAVRVSRRITDVDLNEQIAHFSEEQTKAAPSEKSLFRFSNHPPVEQRAQKMKELAALVSQAGND